MIQKPQWIIFDVGGVLFDYKSATKDIAHYLEIPEDKLIKEAIKYDNDGELGKITFEDAWKKILKTFKKEKEIENIFPIWWEKKRWMIDTQKLIRQLHLHKYHIALFTNNWLGVRDKWLLHNEFTDIINYRFESALEKVSKPNEKFYMIVEERLHVEKDAIFFIDDSKPNITTAKKRHWQAFHYTIGEDNGKTANEELRKLLL